jgi:hypothetical protein
MLLLAVGDFKAIMLNTGEGVGRAVWINLEQRLELFIHEAVHQIFPELQVVGIKGDKAIDLDGNEVTGVWSEVGLDELLEHHTVTQMVRVGAYLLPAFLGHGDLRIWSRSMKNKWGEGRTLRTS